MAVAEVDGRRLRREHNRQAVLEALVALMEDGIYQPTANEIAERAGISPRSLFRYFDDVDDLSRAAIERHMERSGALFDLDVDPTLTTSHKVAAVAEQRARLFDAIAPTARTARAIANRNPVVKTQLGRIRAHLRSEVARVFDTDDATLAAIDVMCSFESYELLRYDQGLSRAKAIATMTAAMTALLAS